MPYQDGTQAFGLGAVSTVTINSVPYKVNSFTSSRTSNVVNSTDENANHDGAVATKAPITGTAELQFSATNVAEPKPAADNATVGVFVASLDNTNTNCFITSVNVNKSKDAYWTAAVSWQAKAN